ncbi:ADP-ribosylglycohydrolase [Sanguibacter gelidistatuariae]|uniref:ADP-ribosylglycohydrolase n=1 Tax=Sanguibacter gelidistatuariae TaxID=1814289 RepID=A0A1G6GT96_9MICO|nr:ADP-ribosylglycohydrolase family protein [Sanguibacter gelidistatuariae]SDB85217.1 ADP-ribosylglycohydrolase [Sanguibacter gelidistatuariae]
MSSDPYQFALLDRASGVLLGQACGDALGVPYEFSWPPEGEAEMRGGGLGPYAPGEWSDDTQMAICIARVSERGGGLRTAAELDEIAAAFEDWFSGGASDVGTQTASVLRAAAHLSGSPSERLTAASRALHEATGRTAGNGALMRTGVVALVALDDREATARAATAVAQLTHADPLAAESCVLWSEAIRVAVTEARLDVRAGLDLLPAERRGPWEEWIADAEQEQPRADLRTNGFAVTALQAAWHAIYLSPYFSPGVTTEYDRMVSHLSDALHRAVRIGGDTDTVAAIAGALLGARHGTQYIAPEWARAVHGWPGMRGIDMSRLGRLTAQRGLGTAPTEQTCPVCGVYGIPFSRYPNFVCRWCEAWVTDENGRPVWLSNTSFSGGFDAHYADGKPASELARSGQVFISGQPFRAGEARFGGVVVEAVAG